ncbi:transcription initiation factor IIA subunit 1 [Diachasma alloeum]|uniref:transcription initiation factor IIA subunit 1 n=1 Tax=Diachasma alloeum TaxID=454923 RepID=UPI0007384C6F|nr:transcription initiation factor IIA subunit 1 [Diachasma alloeum]
MALSQTSVLKLYSTVIEDVIAGVRDSFLDEGVDEQVLLELKQVWEQKLMQTKAVEVNPEPPEPQPPQMPTPKNTTASKAANIGNHFAQQQTSAAANQAQSQQQNQQHQQAPVPQPIRAAVPQHQNVQQTPPAQQVIAAPAALFDRPVPIQITLPGNPATGDGKPKILTIQVPASAIQGNQLHTILTGPVITAAMGFPTDVASRLLQQHVDKTLQGQAALAPMDINQPLQVIQGTTNVQLPTQNQAQGNIAQLDGPHVDTSDDDDEDEEDDNDDDDDLDDDKDAEEDDDAGAREEEPLNSEDDVTDDDPTDLFDTDNVVVCQYDKITRSRNKWKFYLKDGIMSLSGKDYVFQKANGDAEW